VAARATCLLCQPHELVGAGDILEHLRLLHPDAYGDGFMRWPDGRLVVVDLTLEPADFTEPEVTHRCPPDGGGLMPCCGLSPFEVSRTDRITQDPALVTCRPDPENLSHPG
jgi:hypothetical protein